MHSVAAFLHSHEYVAAWVQGLAAIIAIPGAIFAFWKVFSDIKTEKGKIDAIGELLKHQKELRRKEIQPAWALASGSISRTDKKFEIDLRNIGGIAYFDRIEFDKSSGITSLPVKAGKSIDKDQEIHFSFFAPVMESASYPSFEFNMCYRDQDLNEYRVRIRTSNRGSEIDIPEYLYVFKSGKP